MLAWNYANVWESVVAAQPQQLAVVQGQNSWTAARLDMQADSLAAHFLRAGLLRQSKVAAYLYNSPEYLATYLGAFKAGMVPVNTNFRYGPDELFYLFDNADVEAVVFHASFAPQLEKIRERLPAVRVWLAVDEPGVATPSWALRYESVTSMPVRVHGVEPPWGRSADDLLLLYTGGTTGWPKGVMWRQEDLFGVGNFGASVVLGVPPLVRPEDAGERAQRIARPVAVIACPLMHGTGLMGALGTLCAGGCVVLLGGRAFDPEQLWSEVQRTAATRISIVGQPFAAPMLEMLDSHPGRWDLSSVRMIGSSGAMWSHENKQGLLRHMPAVTLADAFASSEAMGLGASLTTVGAAKATAHFALGERCAVFDDAGQRVEPGSGVRGRVAVSGYLPLGYYKDPVKTAQTFPTIEGQRWSFPGDFAEVNSDGTLTLLGRGSQCINTGGEKVFPEEVEEALKRHAGVRDAAVVGLPDPRFGERVCAIVQLRRAGAASESDLISHIKAQLAVYKAPRHVIFVDQLYRAPSGKLDYQATKQFAESARLTRTAADEPKKRD